MTGARRTGPRAADRAVRPDYGRRDFLRAGAAIGLAWGLPALPGCAPDADDGDSASRLEPRAPRRVALGDTGVELSDIGFGSFALDGSVSLVEHALGRGVTHFDTADGYTGGEAERTLGRALRPRRDDVTITTKTLAESDARYPDLMQRLEGSLQRLATDRVDFYISHAVDSLERVHNPEWAELVSRAKEQGKIRFAGISGHGPSLVPCLDAALDAGILDVVLVAYNYIQTPGFIDRASLWLQEMTGRLDWVSVQTDLPRVLQRLKRSGVGVMVMKTLRGARHNDMAPYEEGGATFAQAALRWVLSDPDVDAAVIGMPSTRRIDEYVGGSGWKGPSSGDLALLSRYESLNHQRQCVQGCGACLSACPYGVAIPDALRTGMYASDYGHPALAAGEYTRLGRPAAACMRCSGAPCASACPTGVAIAPLARETHRQLG